MFGKHTNVMSRNHHKFNFTIAHHYWSTNNKDQQEHAPSCSWSRLGSLHHRQPPGCCCTVQSDVSIRPMSFLHAYCITSSKLIIGTVYFMGFLYSYWEPFVSLHGNLIS